MHPVKSSIPGLLFTALLLFGQTALAQTPDGETPANEGVCDELIGGTAGLYGLCVAFCEAQDCEATLDEATGQIQLAPSCKTSSISLLQKYNDRKLSNDPNMPCMTVAANDCQCWTGDELYGLASFNTTYCKESLPSNWALIGTTLAGHLEYAQATPTQCLYYGSDANGKLVNRYQSLDPDQAGVCISSLKTECSNRGF